jgi:hypothetical protein
MQKLYGVCVLWRDIYLFHRLSQMWITNKLCCLMQNLVNIIPSQEFLSQGPEPIATNH